MNYIPIFNLECIECEQTPVVGLLAEREDSVQSTNLCGGCFFSDRAMIDEELWNELPDSTE